MGQYKRDVMKLPPNMNKDKQYRDFSIQEIIALKPGRTIKALTISKYLSRANILFDYARINGEIMSNSAEGMPIKKNKRADGRKIMYDTEELKRIFGSDKYPLMHSCAINRWACPRMSYRSWVSTVASNFFINS